jgi:hypothetical protein
MACKQEITLFCDLQGTLIDSIDLADFCEVDKDESGAAMDIVTLPFSLRATWEAILAKRVVQDLVVGHSRFEDLQRLFIADDEFFISRLTHNGAAETCGRATSFRQKMTTSITKNTMFRVSPRLLPADVTALGLHYRDSLTPTGRFSPEAALVLTPPATLDQPPVAPPLAPNKLDICMTMDLKYFNNKFISGLTWITDIQRWYNVLHSIGCICGVYTVPWECFMKLSPMGTLWDIASLEQIITDRDDLMSSAIHFYCRLLPCSPASDRSSHTSSQTFRVTVILLYIK